MSNTYRIDPIPSNLVYEFSPIHQPVLTVEPGSEITFGTHDASDNQLYPECNLGAYDRMRSLPATGPVAVVGAEPGDVLAVDILEIDLPEAGYLWVRPGLGPYAPARETTVMRVPIGEGGVQFSRNLTLPLRPMVGIVAVAPAAGPVETRPPGPHGGNLDCSDVAPGNRLMLPVQVPGAYLYLGDIHAAMGDGEVGGTGVEVTAAARVRVSLVRDQSIPRPRVRTASHLLFLADGHDLDEAAAVAVEDALAALGPAGGLTRSEALMLLSAAGDVRVLQVVNGRCGVAVSLPLPVFSGGPVGGFHHGNILTHPGS